MRSYTSRAASFLVLRHQALQFIRGVSQSIWISIFTFYLASGNTSQAKGCFDRRQIAEKPRFQLVTYDPNERIRTAALFAQSMP